MHPGQCVAYRLVTDSRDNLVIPSTAFAGFWYVTIRTCSLTPRISASTNR